MCKCGRTPYGEVTLGLTGGTASYRGFTQCGSVWVCPVCSPRILLARRNEISEAMTAWTERGGAFYTETLTMPHSKQMGLGDLMETISKAREAWNRSRSLSNLRKKLGIVGYFKVVEIPRSYAYGWHPHYVYVFFADHKLSDDELNTWRKVSQSIWRKSLEAEGVIRVNAKAHHLAEILNPNKMATYATKYVDYDYAQAPSSRFAARLPKLGPRSHWDILSSWMASQSDDDKKLWHEWVSSMKGRRFITWSEKLRSELRLSASKEDAEIVQEEEHEPLLAVDKESIHELVSIPRRQAEYLSLLEELEFEDFLAMLKDDGIKVTLTKQGEDRLKKESNSS
jgi:thiaminase